MEFDISGNGEDYIELSASYLYVKVKITNPGGSHLSKNESVTSVNLFLHVLFSQINVSLNERAISTSSNTYLHHSYIETLLNYREDVKKSLLDYDFFKDKHSTFTDLSLTTDENP